MADGFESGTRSAAAGGNTTVLAFALQPRGQSLLSECSKTIRGGRKRATSDFLDFHLIVTDPAPWFLGQELPALVSSGIQFHDLRQFLVLTDRIARGLHGRREADIRAVDFACRTGRHTHHDRCMCSGREAVHGADRIGRAGRGFYIDVKSAYNILVPAAAQRVIIRRAEVLLYPPPTRRRKRLFGAASSAGCSGRSPQTIVRFGLTTSRQMATPRADLVPLGAEWHSGLARTADPVLLRALKKDAFRSRSSSR